MFFAWIALAGYRRGPPFLEGFSRLALLPAALISMIFSVANVKASRKPFIIA
jgi:hypothetical protein